MRIHCPHCGERGSEEFSYFGDAAPRRPDDSGPEAMAGWMDYVYLRTNSAGEHRELWQHIHGCRAWLVVTRNTRTHAISAAEAATDAAFRVQGQA